MKRAKRLLMESKQAKLHHPFCVYLHNNRKDGEDWSCVCFLMKKYLKFVKTHIIKIELPTTKKGVH
jgi:hypothetical protein